MTTRNTTTLTINQIEYHIHTDAAVSNHLATLPRAGFSEVWLVIENGPAISMLLNHDADRALVIFGHFDGDPGLSSRSSEPAWMHDQPVRFCLSNAQDDDYPSAWTVPISAACAAVAYTLAHRQPAPWIRWHDDS